MPAALKHEEDGGTETRRFFKIAEQGIGSDPKLDLKLDLEGSDPKLHHAF